MNELIRDLEKRSGIEIYGLGLDRTKWESSLEKFAQLIVAECIDICNCRVGNSDYNTGRMHCVSDLKEYFGIK